MPLFVPVHTQTVVISSNTSNIDLKALIPSSSDRLMFDIIINSGVTISATGSSIALDTGTGWHGASFVKLTNKGTVGGATGSTGATGSPGASGGGGSGGGGGFGNSGVGDPGGPGSAGGPGGTGGPGSPGGTGTTSFRAQIPILVDNSAGVFNGGTGGPGGLGGPGGAGGGGGGGGGGGIY